MDDISIPAAEPAPGSAAAHKRPRRLPGDRRADAASMIRVDQAGEYGAARIYAGQLAVLGRRHPVADSIRQMAEQEARHLAIFDALLHRRRVRPTLLQPIWHMGGSAVGVVTALLGPRAAMACTAAVETEIDRHYATQRAALDEREGELRALVVEFQEDEREHRRTALAARAESLPAYPLFAAVIRAGCRVAIALSKRL